MIGGWAGGNASKDLAKNADLMWKQSVWSSAISATIGSRFLKPGGVLTLTGADAALNGTPGMIGYGLAKAAVHQLTKSLAEDKSGLPDNSLVVSILPITLDTPMNRKWMPKADFSTWTPLDFIAEYELLTYCIVFTILSIQSITTCFVFILEHSLSGPMEAIDLKTGLSFVLLPKTIKPI